MYVLDTEISLSSLFFQKLQKLAETVKPSVEYSEKKIRDDEIGDDEIEQERNSKCCWTI
jgi:hypothetical protein